jgi:very-short-patch-repair endonuclease
MVQIRVNRAKQSLDANAAIKDKAKKLGKKMTEAEKILWSKIRNRKVNRMYFRRQHPYGIYILDFFCFEANLVIEVDGLIHLSKHEYDLERTKYIESSGLTIIRFRNADIENRIGWVLEKIQEVVDPFPLEGNKKGGNSIKKDSPNLVKCT